LLASSVLDAFLLNLMTHYVLWCQYPQKASGSLHYVELIPFGLQGKTPRKLGKLLHIMIMWYVSRRCHAQTSLSMQYNMTRCPEVLGDSEQHHQSMPAEADDEQELCVYAGYSYAITR